MTRAYTRGPYKVRPVEERFMERVHRTDTCWLWTGSFGTTGYGMMNVRSVPWKAHRLAYTLFRGPIPDGMHVCHSCDVPACVNPDHLFLGTNDDNVADREAKGRNRNARKTHCPHGHSYTPDNTRLCRPSRPGLTPRRVCLACEREFGRGSRTGRPVL